jgi:hypothetical protein
MLFIFGKRTARIGRYIDEDHICYPCKSYDREILVYQPYFHFCFIPVFPIGRRQFEMHCRNCGDDTRLDSVLNVYVSRVKTPFYLFSALILSAGLAIFWFYWDKNNQKQKIEFVKNPAVGDVYTIMKAENNDSRYYFLRIMDLKGDSLLLLHNNLDYGGFVSSFAADDYFVKEDTLILKRKQLLDMLNSAEIFSVERGYSKGSDFNRIQ